MLIIIVHISIVTKRNSWRDAPPTVLTFVQEDCEVEHFPLCATTRAAVHAAIQNLPGWFALLHQSEASIHVSSTSISLQEGNNCKRRPIRTEENQSSDSGPEKDCESQTIIAACIHDDDGPFCQRL